MSPGASLQEATAGAAYILRGLVKSCKNKLTIECFGAYITWSFVGCDLDNHQPVFSVRTIRALQWKVCRGGGRPLAANLPVKGTVLTWWALLVAKSTKISEMLVILRTTWHVVHFVHRSILLLLTTLVSNRNRSLVAYGEARVA